MYKVFFERSALTRVFDDGYFRVTFDVILNSMEEYERFELEYGRKCYCPIELEDFTYNFRNLEINLGAQEGSTVGYLTGAIDIEGNFYQD